MDNLGNLPSEINKWINKIKREYTSLKHLFWHILVSVAFCDNLKMSSVAKKTEDILVLWDYCTVDAWSGHKIAL